MPTYGPPKINTELIWYASLYSQADPTTFQNNPTIAAGDATTSLDGGTVANFATLPAVTPASSKQVKFTLGTAEMNGANAHAMWQDLSGAETIARDWNFATVARQIDDLATPTNITAGTITTVTNLTNAPTAGDLTATMKTSVTTAATAATPVAASVTGAVGSVTGAVGSVAGAVGSVTGAVGSVTGAVGSVTGNVGGNVVGSVASVTAGVTLAASAIQAIWDAATSALTTAGSIGKWILDKLDVVVSTRLATAGYTAPPSAASVATQVRTELGTELARVDVAISTRGTSTYSGGAVASVTGAVGSVTGLTASDVAAIKAKTDSLTFTVAGHVDANVQRVNDVALVGDGSATPWGPA